MQVIQHNFLIKEYCPLVKYGFGSTTNRNQFNMPMLRDEIVTTSIQVQQFFKNKKQKVHKKNHVDHTCNNVKRYVINKQNKKLKKSQARFDNLLALFLLRLRQTSDVLATHGQMFQNTCKIIVQVLSNLYTRNLKNENDSEILTICSFPNSDFQPQVPTQKSNPHSWPLQFPIQSCSHGWGRVCSEVRGGVACHSLP